MRCRALYTDTRERFGTVGLVTDLEGESKTQKPFKTFAYISACGHVLQTQIYSVVCHSYFHLRINIGPTRQSWISDFGGHPLVCHSEHTPFSCCPCLLGIMSKYDVIHVITYWHAARGWKWVTNNTRRQFGEVCTSVFRRSRRHTHTWTITHRQTHADRNTSHPDRHGGEGWQSENPC